MKRVAFNNFLRQRRLMRRLARRAAPNKGTISWAYRNHSCSVNFDAGNGVFAAAISGIDPTPLLLTAANLDELRTAFYQAVDSYLSAGNADNEATGPLDQ